MYLVFGADARVAVRDLGRAKGDECNEKDRYLVLFVHVINI